MKILFSVGFYNYTGAAWTRIGFFANYWAKKKYSIDILAPFSYRTLHQRGLKKSMNVNIFNTVFNIAINRPSFFIFNVFISFITSTLFLLARRPSIAIVSFPSGDMGVGVVLACKLLRVKYAIDYRDEWEDYILMSTKSRIEKSFYSALKLLLSYIYTKSLLVTTVTPYFLDSLKKRGISDVKLVSNGADITVFKPYDKNTMRKKLRFNTDDFIIVYAGLIGNYYKFDSVLIALRKIVYQIKNVKLLMIGNGPDVSKVLKMAKNLGLINNVVYLGVKKDLKEVAEILSASDIGIIPGQYSKGQLSVKFFEYCACGLPVLACVSRDSILAKLIIEHKIGLTVSPISENQIAEAIYNLNKNESFRENAANKARLLIEEKFDRAKIAENFLELIIESANRKNRL